MFRQPNSKVLRDRASDLRRIAEFAPTNVGRHIATIMADRYEMLAAELEEHERATNRLRWMRDFRSSAAGRRSTPAARLH